MIDIVERLRFDATRCELHFSAGVAGIIDDAADEIESLRGSLVNAQNAEAGAKLLCEEYAAKITAMEEALDNSQSLLVMIVGLGDGHSAMGFEYASGITTTEWKTEGLTKLLDEQIVNNRAALKPPSGNG